MDQRPPQILRCAQDDAPLLYLGSPFRVIISTFPGDQIPALLSQAALYVRGTFMSRSTRWLFALFLLVMISAGFADKACAAASKKAHVVVLGMGKKVAYSRAGDPAGAQAGEESLTVRALIVDGGVKEWTTGSLHDVTDRSFVVRRAIRLNDTLPGDKTSAAGPSAQWVWQRGPWLLVDRATGRITPLKLPDYDPGVSQVSWFRDYAAYCGLTASGKSLYAVVAQVARGKALLAKKLSAFDAVNHADPVCGAPEWQREPMRVTFRPTGSEASAFDLVPGSAVLVEDSDEDSGTADQ